MVRVAGTNILPLPTVKAGPLKEEIQREGPIWHFKTKILHKVLF